MKNKRNVLSGLVIMLAGIAYFPAHAQQKNVTHRANFSGEWKAKESISMGGNIVCTYNAGDRMLAKTMKIADHVNFLTIEASSSFADEAPVKSLEKLTFDGKAREIFQRSIKGKKFTVKLSADGQTMTVSSIIRLTIAQKQDFIYVTEVWKLNGDGKSISVQTKARSGLLGRDRERSWTTVFNKVA